MDGMDRLVQKVTEMRLSMEIIDGYNDKTKDYCTSLIERVKNAKMKKIELNSLLEQFESALQEQDEIMHLLEEKRERLASFQNIALPKELLTEDEEIYVESEMIKGLKNLEISPSVNTCTDDHKAKENLNPIFGSIPVSNTFTEDSLGFANSTFLKKDMTNLTPKPRNDLEISINFVTNDLYSQIPSYMKGRVTLDNINEFINFFNVTLTKKYELIKKAKKLKTKPDLEQCLIWKEQEVGELKGSYFCTAEDFDKLGNIKIGHKKYQSIITMLRHVKRIKEVRQSKVIYYVACF